jgi:hypothetical protein
MVFNISSTMRQLLTFILRAADIACEKSFAASVGFQQITAVRAEDQRSDGGHCEIE